MARGGDAAKMPTEKSLKSSNIVIQQEQEATRGSGHRYERSDPTLRTGLPYVLAFAGAGAGVVADLFWLEDKGSLVAGPRIRGGMITLTSKRKWRGVHV